MPNSQLTNAPPESLPPTHTGPVYPLLVTSFEHSRFQFSLLTLIVAATVIPPFTFLIAWFVDGRIAVALAAIVPTLAIVLTATAYSFCKPVVSIAILSASFFAGIFALAELCCNTAAGHHFFKALDGQKTVATTDYAVSFALLFGFGYVIGGILGCGLSISRNG